MSEKMRRNLRNTRKKWKSLRKQNYKQWHSIQSEDLSIIQGMQEGRNSPIYNGGNFSPVMDNPTHDSFQ